jgi:hypothetical protein
MIPEDDLGPSNDLKKIFISQKFWNQLFDVALSEKYWTLDMSMRK